MTSKTTLALKLYYGATEKHIKAFWSMQERDVGIEGKMFGATECRLMCEMGIPAYKENLTTWGKVLDYLCPLGDKMYRIHKRRKFFGRIFGNYRK
jgi:hypothetical protein